VIKIKIVEDGAHYLVKIVPGKEYVIGRSSSCNIKLNDENSSGKHCKIYLNDSGAIIIEDLDSKNGTRLNGIKLNANSKIKFYIGDNITIAKDVHLSLDASMMVVKEKKVLTRNSAVRDNDKSGITVKQSDDTLQIVDFNNNTEIKK
jgi:pSer/pThr/pTyr-binding forkhead associated (FHA) protein